MCLPPVPHRLLDHRLQYQTFDLASIRSTGLSNQLQVIQQLRVHAHRSLQVTPRIDRIALRPPMAITGNRISGLVKVREEFHLSPLGLGTTN